MEEMRVKDIVTATGGRLLCGDENTPVYHIKTDSRSVGAGDLFVPLKGEKVDGHRFLAQAVEGGAAAVLTSGQEPAGSCACVAVEDTLKALQDIGRYCRSRLSLPLVGVTGSVGKTTTREMIAEALSGGFRVFRTHGNFNSQVGLPITMSEISKGDQIGVIELGMSEPGELTIIAQIARIAMAVITNIGDAHIEQLGTRENILREKLTIQDGLEPGGIVFLNGDDELLKQVRARDGFETFYYGTGENCDYRAEDVRMESGTASFVAVHGEQRVPVRLNVMGAHNVLNALAALGVADQVGLSMARAAKNLEAFHGFSHRQQIFKVGGMAIMDDTYNASPVSMAGALEVLASMDAAGKKIAVLADMLELGPQSEEFHRQMGECAVKAGVDLLITVGQRAMAIEAEAKRLNPELSCVHFEEVSPVCSCLKQAAGPGDFILFKGSNGMRLMDAVDEFMKDLT